MKSLFQRQCTLTLSPEEREQQALTPDNFCDCRTVADLRVTKNRRKILPLLGEKAGVREDS